MREIAGFASGCCSCGREVEIPVHVHDIEDFMKDQNAELLRRISQMQLEGILPFEVAIPLLELLEDQGQYLNEIAFERELTVIPA